ncbi:MAG: FkbM family methyltransferase [Geminicoccaceae bacterium]
MTLLQRLARRFGYDLIPRKKKKIPSAQLVAILKHHRIDTVLDVGANVGQYGQRLRDWGYEGRIISFEPLASAHAQLVAKSAPDPAWKVVPRMAIGDHDGDIDIQVSAETDMSSILPQSDLLQEISPTSAIQTTERVPIHRLDTIAKDYVTGEGRAFLKIDTQGFEPQVLDGSEALLPGLVGVQLEMSLVPLYQGERDYLAMIERLEAGGFALHLVLPGYFERKLARMVEIDGVFVREAARLPSEGAGSKHSG